MADHLASAAGYIKQLEQALRECQYDKSISRNTELEAQLAEAKRENEALREALRWRTELPSNLDECMEIAIPRQVGWYQCIGYVLEDHTVTEYDGEHVGYEWVEGALWRPVTEPMTAIDAARGKDE
jgi:hypothetical protein